MQPPAWTKPDPQHTGRPAAACMGRIHTIRCQQSNRPADAGMDRARSISTPVNLPIEPARCAASEAVDLQLEAWIGRSTCSLQTGRPEDICLNPARCQRCGRPAAIGMDRARSIHFPRSGRASSHHNGSRSLDQRATCVRVYITSAAECYTRGWPIHRHGSSPLDVTSTKKSTCSHRHE